MPRGSLPPKQPKQVRRGPTSVLPRLCNCVDSGEFPWCTRCFIFPHSSLLTAPEDVVRRQEALAAARLKMQEELNAQVERHKEKLRQVGLLRPQPQGLRLGGETLCTGVSPGNGLGSILSAEGNALLVRFVRGRLVLTFLLLSGSPSRISATICVWRVSWQQSTHILVQAACLTCPGLLGPLFRGQRASGDGLSPGLRWRFERLVGALGEGKGRTKDGGPAVTQSGPTKGNADWTASLQRRGFWAPSALRGSLEGSSPAGRPGGFCFCAGWNSERDCPRSVT